MDKDNQYVTIEKLFLGNVEQDCMFFEDQHR